MNIFANSEDDALLAVVMVVVAEAEAEMPDPYV